MTRGKCQVNNYLILIARTDTDTSLEGGEFFILSMTHTGGNAVYNISMRRMLYSLGEQLL